jgi:hypothetical protein
VKKKELFPVYRPGSDATELRRYVGMANAPMFDAWTVPPQNMSANGPATQGTYIITGWQAQTADPDAAAPAEAKAMVFFDESDGAFDPSTGIFSVPKSGNYRHSMYMRIRGNNDGNYGIFLRVNGVRHVGDFFQDPQRRRVRQQLPLLDGVLARRRRRDPVPDLDRQRRRRRGRHLCPMGRGDGVRRR